MHSASTLKFLTSQSIFFKPNMCPRAQSIITLEANRFMKITGPNKLIKYIPKMIIMIKVNE